MPSRFIEEVLQCFWSAPLSLLLASGNPVGLKLIENARLNGIGSSHRAN